MRQHTCKLAMVALLSAVGTVHVSAQPAGPVLTDTPPPLGDLRNSTRRDGVRHATITLGVDGRLSIRALDDEAVRATTVDFSRDASGTRLRESDRSAPPVPGARHASITIRADGRLAVDARSD